MNRKGIIHRDLKPENILLSSKENGVFDVRIADFGFATFVDCTQYNNIEGSNQRRSYYGSKV
jgi:serine/threonine protein kinase